MFGVVLVLTLLMPGNTVGRVEVGSFEAEADCVDATEEYIRGEEVKAVLRSIGLKGVDVHTTATCEYRI